MTAILSKEELASMRSFLPWLKQQRGLGPLENDVFEALTYWVDLGDRAHSGDTRVNYSERAREEKELLSRLLEAVPELPKEKQKRYLQVFDHSKHLLEHLESIPPDEGGYLGTRRALRSSFGFLQTDYAFQIVRTEPTGLRYSSGAVYIELQYPMDPALSCSFGPDSEGEVSFWLDDLLFLSGDERYRSIQSYEPPQTEEQVQAWFSYLASIWKQYGDPVLKNSPGVFGRLAEAQAHRDAEYTIAVEKLGGNR